MRPVSVLAMLFTAALPLVAGSGLWSSAPASFQDITKEAYPIGNGKLGGMDRSLGMLPHR